MGKPATPAATTTPTTAPKPIVMSKPKEASSGGGGGGGGAPKSFAGFQQFAQTGGFSPEDLANIRARAVSPVRAVYANAQQNVNRQRALQGGYSPGFNVLQARMAREQGQGISDAATNAEAGLAEMVQKGKLAGLQGMAGTEGRGGGGGGGGSSADTEPVPMENALVPEPEKKPGFWGGKFGSALKKVGQIALPIAATAFTGGLAAPVTAGLSAYGAKIGSAIIGGKK